MEQSVRMTAKKTLLYLAALFTLHTAFAQSPLELVFKNPALVAGVAGKDGAVYRFSNITTDIDGLLKIKKRSGTDVVLKNIDLYKDPEKGTYYGYENALQPQVGLNVDVCANNTWWMQFELKFVKAGTTEKKELKNFVITALDVDGDNVTIQEFIQMNNASSQDFSTVTHLKSKLPMAASLLSPMDADGDNHGSNLSGTDYMVQGPVLNFTDIDFKATSVMATYKYKDKDAITFVIGASSGNRTSDAGMRLNSLWFKAFSLAPQSTLPLKLEQFSASYADKNVTLTWKTAAERNFSHFVIERSLDGKTYSDIALVFGAGNTSENSYSYKDKNVAMPAGVAYYRLRLVDEDRTFSYSLVSVVYAPTQAAVKTITVFPNPATSSVGISIPAAWQGKTVRLKIYNSVGTVQLAREIKQASAAATVAIGSLPAGIYIVEAACNGEAAQQRIFKN